MTKDQVHEVCLLGTGKTCCRYLVGSGAGFHCAKLYPSIAATINQRVLEGRMNATGDNCGGYNYEETLTWEYQK